MPPLIAIVGPTSSGKTGLSIDLAREFKKQGIVAEIVSADSRQVYKGLDLLSGKVTKREMCSIPHHLLDVADPARTYSVVRFKRDAERAIAGIHKRGHVPILVGGTGFYVDAVTKGIVLPEVPANKTLRKKLEALSPEKLFAMLKKLDPARAKTVDSKNPVRLVRAIEIATTLGSVPPATAKPKYEVITIAIDLPDEELRKKIHIRLFARIRSGMIAEARRLHERGLSYKRMEELGLESRYVAMYLQGKITKADMLRELETAIWHYAKRQRTWFKKLF
jgi:tRNA dimethylallyltransferase